MLFPRYPIRVGPGRTSGSCDGILNASRVAGSRPFLSLGRTRSRLGPSGRHPSQTRPVRSPSSQSESVRVSPSQSESASESWRAATYLNPGRAASGPGPGRHRHGVCTRRRTQTRGHVVTWSWSLAGRGPAARTRAVTGRRCT
jgi:hypothetical protein